MGTKLTRELAENWRIGETQLTAHGSGRGALKLMEKKGGELYLAEKMWGKNGIAFKVEAYPIENITILQGGGCIESAIPTREITVITKDEYYGHSKPKSKVNEKYLEVLRRWG